MMFLPSLSVLELKKHHLPGSSPVRRLDFQGKIIMFIRNAPKSLLIDHNFSKDQGCWCSQKRVGIAQVHAAAAVYRKTLATC
jgi:hypothetical protein